MSSVSFERHPNVTVSVGARASSGDVGVTFRRDTEGMRAEEVDVAETSETSLASAAMRSALREEVPGHTRTSSAWASIALGLFALVVMLIFAIQNLSSVEISFLSLHWAPPLAVVLLLASAFGGIVVFAFGAARIGQLRMQARRLRRRSASAHG